MTSWVQGSDTSGPWIDRHSYNSLIMSPRRHSTYVRRPRGRVVRRGVLSRQRTLMRMVSFLIKQPYHIQKFFLNFLDGQRRAELSRLLAAYRLRSRMRNYARRG